MPTKILVKDLSPKFLNFYERAIGTDPDTRWALFKEHYDFAAVPPTEAGWQMARQMLDACFDRYPEVLDRVGAGAGGFRPELVPVLAQVEQVLGCDDPFEIVAIFYVGMLEPNAFAVLANGRYMVNLPLETNLDRTPYLVAHELAHLVHFRLSGDQGGWLRPVGTAAMQEGIAIWTSAAVFPGHGDWEYIAFHDPGWLDQCRAAEGAILRGIRPHLAVASPEALQRFIFGPGPGGLPRELYYAGYRAVGHLLAQGYTLAQVARLTEAESLPLLDRTLAELAG